MGAALHNVTMLHHNDLSGILNCAESVGDDDDGLLATLDEGVDSFLHLMLTLSVQSGSCFIEEQNLGLTDEGSCDGDTLLLSTGKLDTTLSNNSIINIREQISIVDEVVGARFTASIVHHLLNLLRRLACQVEAIGNILTNCS